MKTMRLTLGLVGWLGASMAMADPPAHAANAHRQLNVCMSKSMAANRTLSYNDAAKRCKAELSRVDSKPQNEPVISRLEAKPLGTPAP